MTLKGWCQGAVIATATTAAMTLTATASTAAGPPAPNGAAAQTPPIRQELPPGFTIRDGVLYNASNQAVDLPPGFTIRDGVIYDGNGTVAIIRHQTTTVNTGTPGGLNCTHVQQAQPPKLKPFDIFGLVSNIVSGALNLGAGVTQASFCYANQTTQAVLGPGGALQLREMRLS